MKTAKTKKLLLEHLKKIPIVQVATEKSGISRACYYKWRAADPDFAKQADDALAEGIESLNDLTEAQLVSLIKDRNITAVLFWLRSRHKAYSNKLEVSATIKHDAWTPEREELYQHALKLAGGIIDSNLDILPSLPTPVQEQDNTIDPNSSAPSADKK